MKYYAGLDVGLKSTFLCVVDSEGHRVHESVVDSDGKAIGRALKSLKHTYERVGLETGQLSIWLSKELAARGFPVVCMDARQVSTALSTVVNKTDKNDARGIAQLLRCGLYREVHVKSDHACDQKLLLGARRQLVEQVGSLEASLRGFLKIYGITLGPAKRSWFIPTMRERIAKLSESGQVAMNALVDALEQIRHSLAELDASIRRSARDDEQCRLLMTIPGVGPLVSMTYLATLDEAGRFRNSRSVGAYMGLTPRQYASGETQRQGSISLCGPRDCRSMLYEAAHCMLHFVKLPLALKRWGQAIAKKKGMKKAVVALARRLAVIMHRMLITGQPFDNAYAAA